MGSALEKGKMEKQMRLGDYGDGFNVPTI